MTAILGCHSSENESDEIVTTTQELSCGAERWSVKTGTDRDAALVAIAPSDTTIAALIGLPRPASLPSNSRVAPYEMQTYRVRDVTLTKFKLETDSDYHLVISDGAQTMIAEIPAPDCVGATSPFLPGIRNARATFDSTFIATTFFQTTNTTATVEGVGFFDFFHRQTGIAPNAFELHPITGICFGAACQVPLTDGGVPGNGRVPDEGSGSSGGRGGSGGCGCRSIPDVADGVALLCALLLWRKRRPVYPSNKVRRRRPHPFARRRQSLCAMPTRPAGSRPAMSMIKSP